MFKAPMEHLVLRCEVKTMRTMSMVKKGYFSSGFPNKNLFPSSVLVDGARFTVQRFNIAANECGRGKYAGTEIFSRLSGDCFR